MRLLFNGLHRMCSRSSLVGSTHQVRHASTYDGEGKTHVHILNHDFDYGLLLNSVSKVGFELNNGTTILGSLVIFQRSVLSWKIQHPKDINAQALSLFKILDPKMDILVLGLGDQEDTLKYSSIVHQECRKIGINFELLTTEVACSTFNFLNAEARNVVGALIPPRILMIRDDDTISSSDKYYKGESIFSG